MPTTTRVRDCELDLSNLGGDAGAEQGATRRDRPRRGGHLASLVWRQEPLADGVPGLLEEARARNDDARFMVRLAAIAAQLKE